MKIYILVEGKATEMKFYPALIKHYHPEYLKASDLSELSDDSYYIISGLGMPSTMQRITNCLKDICAYNSNTNIKIVTFVVVFDRDRYSSLVSAEQAIHDKFSSPENTELIKKSGVDSIYIIQNPCIETWFLGNREFLPSVAETKELQALFKEYDIRLKDPEYLVLKNMGEAASAKHYLDCIFKEKGYGLGYHKSASMDVIATSDYIQGIEASFGSKCIQSFHYVYDLMQNL